MAEFVGTEACACVERFEIPSHPAQGGVITCLIYSECLADTIDDVIGLAVRIAQKLVLNSRHEWRILRKLHEPRCK